MFSDFFIFKIIQIYISKDSTHMCLEKTLTDTKNKKYAITL